MMKKLLCTLLCIGILLACTVTVATAAGNETPTARAGASSPLLAQEVDGHYYKFFDTSVPWAEADAICRSLGGHLVTVADAEENQMVHALIAPYKVRIWLGGNDLENEGTFVWVTGEPLDYTNWAPNEPNDQGGQDHMQMYENGQWDDTDKDKLPFVCEWDPGTFEVEVDFEQTVAYGNHRYAFFAEPQTWEMAAIMCQQRGGYLVAITDAEENNFVHTFVQSQQIWIGASDITTEGIFCWINGETVEYQHWSSGEPNNGSGNQDCAQMYSNGLWDDEKKHIAKAYVCEWNVACISEAGAYANHAFSDWTETTPATCETAGQSTRTCTQCGTTESKALPAPGHRYGTPETTSAPTCAKTGLEVRTCTVCGGTEETEIPMLEHRYGAYQTVSGSPLIPPIVKERACTLCGHSESANDWSFVWVPILVLVALVGVIIGAVNYAKAFRRRY